MPELNVVVGIGMNGIQYVITFDWSLTDHIKVAAAAANKNAISSRWAYNVSVCDAVRAQNQ